MYETLTGAHTSVHTQWAAASVLCVWLNFFYRDRQESWGVIRTRFQQQGDIKATMSPTIYYSSPCITFFILFSCPLQAPLSLTTTSCHLHSTLLTSTLWVATNTFHMITNCLAQQRENSVKRTIQIKPKGLIGFTKCKSKSTSTLFFLNNLSTRDRLTVWAGGQSIEELGTIMHNSTVHS